MSTKIFIGSLEVYESGSVTVVNNQSILFELSENFKIRLTFISLPDKKQDLFLHVNPLNELEFQLTNFNNPLGTQLVEPINVGVFKGRPFYCHFYIKGDGDNNNKVITYTWLLGKEVPVEPRE